MICQQEIRASKRVKRARIIVEPPLPRPFMLPLNYPKAVKDGLRKGALTGRSRSKFLASVASYIYSFKELPTHDELVHIAEQIVAQFPFLSIDGSYVSMQIFLF